MNLKSSLKVFKKSSLFLSGLILGLFVYFIVSKSSFEEKKSPREIALMELDLRESIKKLKKDYKIKTSLIRNSDSITVRIWDKGVFPIDGWRLSNKGESFIESFISEINNIDEPKKIEIDSHYDSVNPVRNGNKEFNKIKISNYRALQVAHVFAKKGFDLTKISYRGLSDRIPVVKDRDVYGNYIEEAGDLNRRVDITLKIAGVSL